MSRAQLTSTVEQNTGGAVAPFVAGKNFFINGGMDIWQRGTSTSGIANRPDQWYIGGTATSFFQSTDAPTGFSYSLDMGGTNVENMIFKLESAQATLLAGQTVTISAYVKNISGADDLRLQIFYANSKDNFSATTQYGGNNLFCVPTSTWTRYTYTLTLPSNVSNGLSVVFFRNHSSGAEELRITGVQLELGSVATPFARAGGTLQGELALCQRYYYRVFPNASASILCPSLYCGSSTLAYGTLQFPTQMRIMPTALEQTGTASDYVVYASIGGTTCSAIPTFYDANYNSAVVKFTVASGLNTGYSGYARTGSTAGYLGWSAEL